MRWIIRVSILLALIPLNGVASPAYDFSKLRLIDSVDCAAAGPNAFAEYPQGASEVTGALGEQVRSLPNGGADMKYFAYQLGRGKGLKANTAYVLRVIYPEDVPRTVFVLNRGAETARGFHTGRTTGDGIAVPYVNNNTESLELPLSGRMESWDMLFFLQERFPGLKQPRDEGEFPRDQVPADGFWVLLLQLSRENDPLSAGVAVKRLELYEAPPLNEIAQKIPELPAGLPKRHLFWREEMADGVVGSSLAANRGFDDALSWYEGKFQLMRFLGMRTFAKDLLEFGHNQGWDSSKYGGNAWVRQTGFPTRWTRICRRAGELGFDLIPYFEYKGSLGAGPASLGYQKRCRPLSDSLSAYTHITWSEDANADITDPDTFEDLRRILEITVTDEQEKARFAAVWLRTRVSDFPISFADSALGRFQSETGQTAAVTRQRLRSEPALYAAYRTWWFGKRRAFLEQVASYLQSAVASAPVVLFTPDHTEPGRSVLVNTKVIAENPGAWSGSGLAVRSLADALAGKWHLAALTSDTPTWGGWEWQHSTPAADPGGAAPPARVLQTAGFHRAYSNEPSVFTAFRGPSGLAAVRHYSLNEDATRVGEDIQIVGYFVADVDYAGPFVVLPEALAFANGDPTYIGYLASNNFNRGNPEFVRRFNANFLALPALPSERDPAMSSAANCVVRKIVTPQNGTYLGMVNTGYQARSVTLQLPAAGRLLDAVTGEVLGERITSLPLVLDPCELRSFRYFPETLNTPPEIRLESSLDLEWRHAFTTHGEWLTAPLEAVVVDQDAGGQVASTVWSVAGGDPSRVRFEDALAARTSVAFHAPGDYVLRLTASDGAVEQFAEIRVKVAVREHRISVIPAMATPLTPALKNANLFDQQAAAGDPPSASVSTNWERKAWGISPLETLLDLGQNFDLTQVWLFDSNGVGNFKVSAGSPQAGWTEIVNCVTDAYAVWRRFDVSATTRYLKLSLFDSGYVGEVVLYGKGHGKDLRDPSGLRRPLSLRFEPEGSGHLQLSFTANPFCTYLMEESTDLVSWTPGSRWRPATPFESRSLSAPAPAKFFRLREIPDQGL